MAGTSSSLSEIFRLIDRNGNDYVNDLKERLDNAKAPEKHPVPLDWIENKIKELGGKTEACKVDKIPWLPYILFADFTSKNGAKTLCVYANLGGIEYGSNAPSPFEKHGKLYVRGAVESVAPALAWIHVLEVLKKGRNGLLPNIKLVFDGLGMRGTAILEDVLKRKEKTFFNNVDYVCVAGGHWLEQKKPCVLHGHRGICYFNMTVKGGDHTQLHSGTYGGVVYEPMADTMFLLSCLADSKGKILIPGVLDDVSPTSAEQGKILCKPHFDVEKFKRFAGVSDISHKEKKSRILTHMLRLPCLSVHGVESVPVGSGIRCAIPLKVTAKFSIRLVENQSAEKVEEVVATFLEEVHRRRGSPNALSIESVLSADPWVGPFDGENVTAARSAVREVYGTDPDVTLYGGSILATSILEKVTGKSPVIIPLGGCDGNPHCTDENIDTSEYIQAHKVLAAYINTITNTR